jgi:hypothetical protein
VRNSSVLDDDDDSHDDVPPSSDDDDGDDALTVYCPMGDDFLVSDDSEFGNVKLQDNGWTIYGSGWVGGRTSYNLLGGYVEWTSDTSHAQNGVNTNLYTISPESGVDVSGYCDIQPNGSPQCMELDMDENNGNCYMTTTWHTSTGTGNGCDEWGCAASTPTSGSVSIRAEFSTDGFMTVFHNGEPVSDYSPYPDDSATAAIVDTMNRIGASLWSTQWEGWVPDGDLCPAYDGNLDSSYFTVSDLQVKGTVVQGVQPTKC